MSLKNKVLLGVPAILVGVMLMAGVMTSVIIKEQSREEAHHLLQNTFNFVRYTIAQEQEKLLASSHQMATLDDMGGKMKYVIDSGPYFKYSIMRPTYITISTVLYNIGSSAHIWKAAIYDTEDRLTASAVMEETGSTLAYVHNHDTSEVAFIGGGEKLTPDSWAVGAPPRDIGVKNKRVGEGHDVVDCEILDTSLCLVARIPIMGKDYNPRTEQMETAQVGTLITVKKLGGEILTKMAGLTGTDINVFGATGLIAGTRKEYQAFTFGSSGQDRSADNPTEQRVRFDDVVVASDSYFQGVLPICSGQTCVAAIVALYSKATAKAATFQVIKLLSVVYLVSIMLIVPMATFMVMRGVIAPIRRTATMMREIAREKDFKTVLNVKSNDEIGELASAFNTMTEDLKRTTTSIDNLNLEITERKKAEEELAHLLSLHQATLEATADGILVVDSAGHVVSSNQKFLELWRIPPSLAADGEDEKLLACVLDQLADPEAFLTKVRQLYSQPEEQSFDLLNFKDGRVFERFSQPHKISGKTIGRVWSFRDVTERVRAEERQTQLLGQLERTNQELKDFAYIVSHDLKAPLRGIKTLAGWISADSADKLSDEGREQLALLLSRVERMHDLIEGILQYSRIGRVKEETVQVNLEELVPDIVDMLAPPENITITVQERLPVILCEPTKAGQVFQNLLGNAVKYMDKPEGKIIIRCVEEGESWKFSVADNGPGIEEKHFEKIFQMFQTLVPRDAFESTGVGLALVKKIVETYGGTIWVESTVGEGSTFFFTLPKTREKSPDEKLPACAAC